MSEIVGMGLKFYQQLEGDRRPQIKLETVERLCAPFGLEAWQLLAPAKVLASAKAKIPKAAHPSKRGPRAKWAGERGE